MSQKNTRTRSVQICILKVNINCKCQGCEEKVKKVKKALWEIQGVVAVKINLEEGKVGVGGNVDPKELLKNLKKHSGKHAEICSIQNPIKKNDNEEGKKSKGSFLGSLFGFGKKSKNGAETCKNCKNCKNNSNSIDEGSNGNVGQMVMVNNNGSMQEHSMMNNEYHHQGGMQLMQMQPSSYDQQQYMQHQRNMNMYPSTMMYGGPHPSMNYNYTANPIHDENVEGCWIM